jgi:ketosteroid isomerase-like protein
MRGLLRRKGRGLGACLAHKGGGNWAGVSQENVELARQSALAWNDGGIDALLEYLDPDVEWHPAAESLEADIYRGHDGVRDYAGRIGEVFADIRIEPLEVIEVDEDRVIAVSRWVGGGTESEMEIDAKWAALISVGPNKKIVRFETFTDKAQALAAAGLRE